MPMNDFSYNLAYGVKLKVIFYDDDTLEDTHKKIDIMSLITGKDLSNDTNNKEPKLILNDDLVDKKPELIVETGTTIDNTLMTRLIRSIIKNGSIDMVSMVDQGICATPQDFGKVADNMVGHNKDLKNVFGVSGKISKKGFTVIY